MEFSKELASRNEWRMKSRGIERLEKILNYDPDSRFGFYETMRHGNIVDSILSTFETKMSSIYQNNTANIRANTRNVILEGYFGTLCNPFQRNVEIQSSRENSLREHEDYTCVSFLLPSLSLSLSLVPTCHGDNYAQEKERGEEIVWKRNPVMRDVTSKRERNRRGPTYPTNRTNGIIGRKRVTKCRAINDAPPNAPVYANSKSTASCARGLDQSVPLAHC